LLRVPVREGQNFVLDRRAVAALEFALIAPVLLLLLAGTFELGRFVFTQNSLQSATAVALRQATIDPTLDEAAVRNILLDNLPRLEPGRLDTVSLERANAAGGNLQEVTVRAVFTFQPVISLVIARTLRIEASAQGIAVL
jgi:hypothetical protein